MANSHSALAPVNFMPKVQAFLNQRLVAKGIARTDFRAKLYSGQSIDFPYVTDMRVQTYTPGTDLTIDNNTATTDTMSINQSRAATFTLDPNQQAQAEDKTINALMANQAAFRIASDIDQKLLKEGVDYAANTVAGGTLSVSNIYSKLTDCMATLHRQNAEGTKFAVLDPERVALLAQMEVANGFNVADNALQNGFVGNSNAGFKIYMSNNLPTTVAYTMDTINTAGKTFTIAGVTFTFVASGAAASAGEISIGADAAANQANFVLAINGTGTPGAATYIDLSTANRRKLQNAGISASAFATNVSTITGYGKLTASTNSADGNNAVGTETGSLLCGDTGSISLGMQIEPVMASAKEPARPMETNYAIHTLYGKKVFYRDTFRLVNFTINI